MKIKDGLNLKGWRVEIPDCGRDDLPKFFRHMNYKVGVEIGVNTGLFTRILCIYGLKVYGVDPWKVYPEYFGLNSNQEKMEENFAKAKRRLSKYDCTLIRKTSMEAVKDFEDGSLDFVYIDGNHNFKYFTEDLWEWSKKVRKGGVISGHDYWNDRKNAFVADVKHVLDGYTKAAKLSKWYVLGKKSDIKVDLERSWFWIN